MNAGRWPSGSPGSGRKISTEVRPLLRFALLILGLFFLSGCTPSLLQHTWSEQALSDAEFRMDARDYDPAESLLKEALARDPGSAEAWCRLGWVYRVTEEFPRARDAYASCLARDPDHPDAQSGVWAVHLLEGEYTEAVREEVRKEIDVWVAEEPSAAGRLTAGCLGYIYLHDTETARELIPRIMAANPSGKIREDLVSEAAEDILPERDLDKKMILIDRYLALFPDPGPWRNLVQGLRLRIAVKDRGDRDLFKEYAESWTREEPENRAAHALAGYWYVEEGVDYDRGAAHLRKALVLIERPDPREKPEHYPDSRWRADLDLLKGRYHEMIGWAAMQSGRWKEAALEFRIASNYLPFDHRLYAHLGRFLEETGDLEGALRAYRKAAEGGSEFEWVEEGLSRLLSDPSTMLRTGPDLRSDPAEPPYKMFAREAGIASFTDITEAAGLAGVKGRRVAWGDYDRDGFEDLLIGGGTLMRNQGDGTFRDVTGEAKLPSAPGANGGVWADFDNDGNLDLYLFASGEGSRDLFVRNRGDGTFEDVTVSALSTSLRAGPSTSPFVLSLSKDERLLRTGVAEPDPDPSEAAAWGDGDRDGWVDLYVANYERPLLTTIERAVGTPDRYYHNNGGGTFSEMAGAAGMASREPMAGRGVAWADFNNDGAPDIHVSNYRLDPNFLWRNKGDGTFEDAAGTLGVAGEGTEGVFGHTIGSAWGDYDNDGDLDLFSGNLAHPRYIGVSDRSMLLENLGPPDYRFEDRFDRSGIRFEETHAEPSFVDYDNDGFLDLYITSTYEKRNSFLYRGHGNGTFTDVTWPAGVRVGDGWGNAFADVDNDGDLDLVVGGGGGVRLFRNDGNVRAWLRVRVVGHASNRAGIGTRVRVTAGTARQIREVEGGKGSGSQHALPAAFGLGDYRGTVDVEVRFPSGIVVQVPEVPVNREIRVEEPFPISPLPPGGEGQGEGDPAGY